MIKNWNVVDGDATFEKDGKFYMALYDESHDITMVFTGDSRYGCMDRLINYHFGEPDPKVTVDYTERW